MSDILYFLPGRKSREQIAEILPGRFESSHASRTVIRGPGDEPAGELLAATDKRLELNLPLQTWQQSGCGAFWFGWWNDAPPAPSDLLRSETIPGALNAAGWMVPRVRKHHLEHGQLVYSLTLPRKPKWDGQRFVSGDVVSRFQEIADLAAAVNESLEQMHRSSWEDPERMLRLPEDAAEIAARILQINHRVGPDELAALEAFRLDFQSLNEILELFVSRDQFHKLVAEASAADDEKKNRPASD